MRVFTMDRNEAVQKLATAGRLSIARAEDLYDSFFPKPVVPQYVADWYEGHKDEFEINLYREVCRAEENYNCGGLTDFQKWLISGKTNPFSVLVNMNQFGYEVDKEPRYTVKLKKKTGDGDYLVRTGTNGLRFYNNIYTQSRAHTRRELEKAGFEWVFDCPGVEVMEVTDGND
jgi:hypothetical protein